MPIYEFRCRRCGDIFEELLPNARVPSPPCPNCGSPGVEKLVSVLGGVHVGSAKSSCPSGATCPSGGGNSCRSCPMAGQ